MLSGSDRGNLKSLVLQKVINVSRCLEMYETNAINQCVGTAAGTYFLPCFSPSLLHSLCPPRICFILLSLLSIFIFHAHLSASPSSCSLFYSSEDMSGTFVLIFHHKIRGQSGPSAREFIAIKWEMPTGKGVKTKETLLIFLCVKSAGLG